MNECQGLFLGAALAMTPVTAAAVHARPGSLQRFGTWLAGVDACVAAGGN